MAKLDEIYQVIDRQHHNVHEIGVLAGLSGLAIFCYEYARFTNTNAPAELGEALLARTIDSINQGYNYPTYCTGIAGAGWAFDYLTQHDLVEVDNDALFSSLDDFLFGVMRNNLAAGNIDFLHGALGYAFYFFKRYQCTSSEALKANYRQYIHYFVEAMHQLAEHDHGALKWATVLQQETGLRGYNLSLSHGMSSTVNLLARLHQYPDFSPITKPLLQGAVQYIARQQHTGQCLSLYPSWVSSSPEERESRMAWCYGDAGIGISFWHAAQA